MILLMMERRVTTVKSTTNNIKSVKYNILVLFWLGKISYTFLDTNN